MFLQYFLVVLAGAAGADASTAAGPPGERDIQHWINRHAHQVHALEVPAARQRVVGDLDGDGRHDVAVLYTLKSRSAPGGESRYLAAFKQQRAATGKDRSKQGRDNRQETLRYHAHVLVSGPGAGEANRVTILDRTLVVEMLTFAPGDAACCPTRASTRRYRLGAQALTLVRSASARHTR